MTGSAQTGPRRAAAMRAAVDVMGAPPSPVLRSLVCPYCGGVTPDAAACEHCAASLDPLSRQATQNQMGPWFVRDEKGPHRPGCSYATLERMAKAGAITGTTVVRGPSTHQFWMLAKHTPGLANLLGHCHNCGETATAEMFACRSCGEPFSVQRDRQHLGLGPSRPLPGSGRHEAVAMHAGGVEGAELVDGPAIRVGGHSGSNPEKSSPDRHQGVDAERVHELERSLKLLKHAWGVERQRAWVSFWCAVFIGVLSLVLLVLL